MKKIAVNTVKNYMKEHKSEQTFQKEFQVGDAEFVVTIRAALTLDEKSMFISRVLSGCFNLLGDYTPEYYHPMFHATILQMCTNLPVLTLKDVVSEDGGAVMDIGAMDELYCALDFDAIYELGFSDMIVELHKLCKAALAWRYRRALAEFANNGVAELTSSAKRLVDSLDKKVNEVDNKALLEYAGRLAKSTGELESGNILAGLIQANEDKRQ